MPYTWTDEPNRPALGPGGAVISSFPSAGFAATVAGHYIVQSLRLPRVGRVESEEVPPIAVVQSGQVHPAVRAYGRPGLALVLSEFPPLSASTGALARAIIAGAEARGARLVLALEGVMPHPADLEEADGEVPEGIVWAASSSMDGPLQAKLVAAGARPLEDGVLGGVSGALLVQGISSKVPVGALLVSAHADVGLPDHRAGAALIGTLDKLLPELAIDTKPLLSQAEMIEKMLRAAMKSREKPREAAPPPEVAQPTIYQ